MGISVVSAYYFLFCYIIVYYPTKLNYQIMFILRNKIIYTTRAFCHKSIKISLLYSYLKCWMLGSLVTLVHRSITCIDDHVSFSLNSWLQTPCQHGYCPSYATFWMQYASVHRKLLVRDGFIVQRGEKMCFL